MNLIVCVIRINRKNLEIIKLINFIHTITSRNVKIIMKLSLSTQ